MKPPSLFESLVGGSTSSRKGGAHYLVWCPVGPVLPHGENKGVSLALVGRPSSDGVTVKMPYGVDVFHQSASHPIFSYWVG